MSLSNHVLDDGTNRKTLQAWGATACTVEIGLAAKDKMTVAIPRDEAITESPFWPKFQRIDLFDSLGNRRFRGWRQPFKATARGSNENAAYNFAGVWETFLEAITFSDLRQYAVDPTAEIVNLTQGYTTEVILSRDLLTGVKISIKDQVTRILDYCLSVVGAVFQYDVSRVPTLIAPEDQKESISCGQAITQVLRFVPEVQPRIDYSVEPPRIVFGDAAGGDFPRAGHVGPEIVDVTAAPNWGTGLSWTGSLSWTDRSDVLLHQFSIIYIFEDSYTETDGSVVKWNSTHVDQNTVVNGSWRTMAATVHLRGLIWNGTVWEAPEPIPADGLALQMMRPFSRDQFELEFQTTAQEVDWVHAPGSLWCGVNGAAELVEANSVLQTVTRDIGRGQVTYKTGLPAHIGADDLLALRRPFVLRKPPTEAGQSQYGFAPPDPKKDKAGTVTVVAATVVDGALSGRKLEIEGVDKGEFTGP